VSSRTARGSALANGLSSASSGASRGVYRVYAASLDQATWRYWRDATAPDFSQRFTGTFSDDGNTITGRGQLSQDGNTWEDDLDLNYQKLA
jgi:hypothetical protein